MRQALPEGETDGIWYSETVLLQTEKNLMSANPGTRVSDGFVCM